jgi:hypothetical protein
MTRTAVGHWYIRESIRTSIPVPIEAEPAQLIQVSVSHRIELIAALRFAGWRSELPHIAVSVPCTLSTSPRLPVWI